uniref:NADH-ubiquinone oxidoreductase chain 1 n=1 Tax=Blastocrithidia nonstop TaxID=2592485 RepID=A0AAT9UQ82_9TRYP
MILIDFFFIILFFVLIILILTGYFSLCERKVLAIVQMRSGPNLCFFGILTPITDGIKLFLKFVNFVVNVNAILLFLMLFSWFFVNLSVIFMLPFGLFTVLPKIFNIFIFFLIILLCDLCLAIFVGYFLVTSVYAFISCSRLLLLILSSESLILHFIIVMFLIQINSYCNIAYIIISQFSFYNFFFCGIFIFMFFLVWFLLECKKLPFDYVECESELIAGVFTELSGIFFVISSVVEIWSSVCFSIIFVGSFFGGFFIFVKLVLFIIGFILLFRVLCFRVKITDVFFLLFFLIYWICLFFIISILIFSCVFLL